MEVKRKKEIEALVLPLVDQHSQDIEASLAKWNPPENRPFPLPSGETGEGKGGGGKPKS